MLGEVEEAQAPLPGDFSAGSMAAAGQPAGPGSQPALSLAQLARYRKGLGRKPESCIEEGVGSLRATWETRRQAAACINGMGEVARFEGDRQEARRRYEAALEIYLAIGATHDVALVYANLGLVSLQAGKLAGAENLLQAALRLASAQDDYPYLRAGVEYNLALAKALRGDVEGSQRLLAEVLDLNARVPIAELDFAEPLERLGRLRAEEGSLEQARGAVAPGWGDL